MAIKPDDVSEQAVENAEELAGMGSNAWDTIPAEEVFAACVNAAIADSDLRAALVRELIAGGHCSPPVWAVRHIYNDSIITLHKDEAEAMYARRRLPRDGYYYCCGHWKGENE